MLPLNYHQSGLSHSLLKLSRGLKKATSNQSVNKLYTDKSSLASSNFEDHSTRQHSMRSTR